MVFSAYVWPVYMGMEERALMYLTSTYAPYTSIYLRRNASAWFIRKWRFTNYVESQEVSI